MWQRIQTVFLVIVILSLIATIFLPIWAHPNAAGIMHELYPLHYSTTTIDGVKTTIYFPYAITAVLLIAAATIAFIQMRKFKNRILQIKLGALNSLFLAGGLGGGVYFASTMVKAYPGGQYGLGLWLPALAVICNWLAMRFIKKDEKLVRDSDRLR